MSRATTLLTAERRTLLGTAVLVACAWLLAARGSGQPAPPEAAPSPPPETIPDAPSPLVRPKLAYLYRGSTWNLSSEEFLVFLPDFPKAVLFRCPAKHVSSDAEFHYFEDVRSSLEWAFERAPEDNFFEKHDIWTRNIGETEWKIRSEEATLATPF